MKGEFDLQNEYGLALPDELEGMDVLDTYMNSEASDVGILVMGQNMNPVSDNPVIRIYLLLKEYDAVYVHQELEAFTFESYGSAIAFLQKLPKMTALELLIMMKAQPV